MKVLLINGSPHKQGCTYTALSEVASALEKNGVETELFHIGNKPIAGCQACGRCATLGHCYVDDPVNQVLDKLSEVDGIVVGSPVYFASASGQVTAFLDRLFYAGASLFPGKVGACVVSCRRGGGTATFEQINKYFTMNNMLVVSSQYWNQVHGNTPDEVRQDLEGLQTMRTLGNNMAWVLKCIEAGKEKGIEFPEAEPRVATNFIR